MRRLPTAESDRIWDRFDAVFDFRPSMSEFPGIREPMPSVTWSLEALAEDPRWRKRTQLTDIVLDGLVASTLAGESVYVLDWQHTCYVVRPEMPPTDMFLPHALERRTREGWPRSPFPDGDYYIFLSEDLSFGSFGHPWERSLCVFGAPLLEKVTGALDELLRDVLRRDGVPVS